MVGKLSQFDRLYSVAEGLGFDVERDGGESMPRALFSSDEWLLSLRLKGPKVCLITLF